MNLLAVVHQPDAGPGVFAEVAPGIREWRPAERPPPPLSQLDALIVLGGGMHVDQEDRHPWLRSEKAFLREALRRGLPTLGVCLGAQLVAEAGGASVSRAPRPEIGWHEVELLKAAPEDPVLGVLPGRFPAFEWHSYRFELPPGAVALAANGAGLQAFRAGERAWGIQFHAEVTGEAVAAWLQDYSRDEDAREVEVDAAALMAETRRRIAGWNAIGRGLCERFTTLATKLRARY